MSRVVELTINDGGFDRGDQGRGGEWRASAARLAETLCTSAVPTRAYLVKFVVLFLALEPMILSVGSRVQGYFAHKKQPPPPGPPWGPRHIPTVGS